jgi:GH24 family phage-related lysozyme (muramidase)
MPRAARRTTPPRQTSLDDRGFGNDQLRALPDVRALCSEILKWEGYRRDMFVDARGNVRTGIGHFLPDARAAVALPWKHRATGLAATGHEVWAAFEQVRAQAAGHAAPAHQRASDLVLPAGFAVDLITRRVQRQLLPAVRRLCPGFDRYPLPAQRALVEMAYDLGISRFSRFSNLIAACEQWNFRKAAQHCHRWTSRKARNEATRALFLEAATPDSSSTPGFAGKNARRDGG